MKSGVSDSVIYFGDISAAQTPMPPAPRIMRGAAVYKVILGQKIFINAYNF